MSAMCPGLGCGHACWGGARFSGYAAKALPAFMHLDHIQLLRNQSVWYSGT